MIDKELEKIFQHKPIDNFVDGFIYLKNAGYNEIIAFFNALNIFANKLVPECSTIIKVVHNSSFKYGYIFMKMDINSYHINHFITFCISKGYNIVDLPIHSSIMIIQDERLDAYFMKLCEDSLIQNIYLLKDDDYNRSKYIEKIFGDDKEELDEFPF